MNDLHKSSDNNPLPRSIPLSVVTYPNPEATPVKDKPIINYSSGESSNPTTLSSSTTPQVNFQKDPINKLTIGDRKRIVVSPCRNPTLTRAMRLWHKTTNALLDPFRTDDECWLHPSLPCPYLSLNGILRPRGTLQRTFIWSDHRSRHSLKLNFGIVTKLIYHDLSLSQQDRYIQKQWHLSHLCGNWVCLNPNHTTMEPGTVNISRNNWFSHRSGCLHDLPCMKELKVALNAHGKLVDHEQQVAGNYGEVVADWEDWSARGTDVDVEESGQILGGGKMKSSWTLKLEMWTVLLNNHHHFAECSWYRWWETQSSQIVEVRPFDHLFRRISTQSLHPKGTFFCHVQTFTHDS